MLTPFWNAGIGSHGSQMAHAEAARAKGEARRAKSDAMALDARLDRLAMTCEALWSLVRDRLGVTEEQLIDRVTELDLSDGKLDGKINRSAVSCPQCGRTIGRRFPRCMYCGQPIAHDPFS